MAPPNTTKVTVNLPDDTVEALQAIAKQNGTTVTEALRQVIETQRFLRDETKNGNRVLIQNASDKRVRQVLFNTPPNAK
jgi:hypothetical protein